MLKLVARPLAVVAALGWVFTLIASIAGLVGFDLPSRFAGVAFAGLFPLWLCAILYMGRLTRGVRSQDTWKAAFRAAVAALAFQPEGFDDDVDQDGWWEKEAETRRTHKWAYPGDKKLNPVKMNSRANQGTRSAK